MTGAQGGDGARAYAARVIHVAEVGSTNTEAMRLALAGEPLPFWLVADRQTRGRGRDGRAWTSLSGNLHASLALRLEAPLAAAPQLSLVAGLALFDAVSSLVPAADLSVKWPNDLLAGDAKLAGILVETSASRAAGGPIAIVGIGMNVAEAAEVAGRQTMSLASLGCGAGIDAVLAALDRSMADWLAIWNAGQNFAAVAKGWTSRAGKHGQRVTATLNGRAISGHYDGLDTDGALLLRAEDGTLHRITVGDVAFPGTS